MICEPRREDTDWAEYDHKNRPVGPACLVCWNTLQAIAPDVAVDDLVKARDSKDPADTDLWSEFEQGRLVNSGESEKGLILPSSDVGTTTQYGMHVYQKIGLVSETDLLRLSGCTPKMLHPKDGKYASVSLKLDGPNGQSTVLWPISLKGLPIKEADGMLKAKIFHEISVAHGEQVLRSQDQLTQNQGSRLFSVCSAALNSNKPLLKDVGKVLTLEDMMKIKLQLEAAKEAAGRAVADAMASAAAGSDSEDGQDIDGDDQDRAKGSGKGKGRGKARAFSIGTLSRAAVLKPKAKVKAKATAKASAAAAPAATSASSRKQSTVAPESRRMSSQEDSPARSSATAKGSSGKLSKADKALQEVQELLSHDQVLLKIAERHLSTKKGCSSKCLVDLNVEEILTQGKHAQSVNGDRGSKVFAAFHFGYKAIESIERHQVIRCLLW